MAYDRNTHCKKAIKTNTKQRVRHFFKMSVHLSFQPWLQPTIQMLQRMKYLGFINIPASISCPLQMSTAYPEL